MVDIMVIRSWLLAGIAVLTIPVLRESARAQAGPLSNSAGASPVTAAPTTTKQTRTGSGQGIENVVVTSRKRSEPLRKVPVAVDVVSHKAIQQQGINSIADLAAITPGLTYDQGISASDTRPAIRGFNIQLGQPSVAILIDGYDTTTQFIASAGGQVLVNLNLLDLNRVEVVKGPQSALYGRNAFGGAIDYITQKPTAAPSGEVDTEVGNYGDYRASGTYSTALNDKVSLRVSLDSDGRQGFYKNTTTDKTLGGLDEQGGSTDFLIKPDDTLTIRVYTEIEHQIQQQSAAVNIKPNGLLPNYDPTANPAHLLPEVVGTIGANASQVNYTGNYPGSRTLVVRNYVSLDKDLGTATFSSRTGFQTMHDHLSQDTAYDATPDPAAIFAFENEYQDFISDTTQVSQEFRLTSANNSKLVWLAGLYLFYENATLNDDTQYYLDHPSFFYPLARTDLIQNSVVNPYTEYTRTTHHASVYGSVGYEILPKLNATAELRMAYEGVDESKPIPSRTAISEYNSGITYGPGGAPEGITYTSGAVASRYINPKFELEYELSPNQDLYANISRGTKPAGLSLIAISSGGFQGEAYKQEKVWEYEVGDKTSWLDNRLQVNADVYFNDYHDQQVSYSDLAVNPPAIGVTNAGKVYGVGEELEVLYRPVPSLMVSAGYSHIDEWFENYISNVASDLEYLPGGNFKGKRVADVPPDTLTATARYETPITPRLNGFLQLQGQYESARYGDNYNTWKLGAFFEPRFQVGIENRRFSLLFFMDNVFDDRTIRSAMVYVDLHNNFNPTALAYLPDPRTFGARLSYRF